MALAFIVRRPVPIAALNRHYGLVEPLEVDGGLAGVSTPAGGTGSDHDRCCRRQGPP